MNDINRHLTAVWQPVTVLVTTFAVLAVSKELSPDKGIIPLDYATLLVLLICTWAGAHVIDASYWYNRNLAMVSNIERQFLDDADAALIHYYFASHRSTNKMISYLSIQGTLPLGIAILVLVFHLHTRVLPTLSLDARIDWQRVLPYAVAFLAFLYLNFRRREAEVKYQEFVKLSPGKEMPASLTQSFGHGRKWTAWEKAKLALGLSVYER